MMSNEGSGPRVPKTLRCCTCDGEEGPCAVAKIVFSTVQQEDAALEPALVLQGQPIHQQRGTLGQRHAACGRRGEGGRAKRTGCEMERAHSQTGRVSTCSKRAYHAEDTGIQCHKGRSQSHRLYNRRQNHTECDHQVKFVANKPCT